VPPLCACVCVCIYTCDLGVYKIAVPMGQNCPDNSKQPRTTTTTTRVHSVSNDGAVVAVRSARSTSGESDSVVAVGLTARRRDAETTEPQSLREAWVEGPGARIFDDKVFDHNICALAEHKHVRPNKAVRVRLSVTRGTRGVHV
jgi:hypothetical protein